MRGLFRALFCTVLALPALVQSAKAQTPFEQLFNPRTALSIILEMTQTTWAAMAAEWPADGITPTSNSAAGICKFDLDTSINRYGWHATDVTILTEGDTRRQEIYPQAGIKKKSFCGSFDTSKPSLTLTLDRNVAANENLAESHLGTTHLSLENSKQDGDLFRQCAGYQVFRTMGIPAPLCSFAALYRRDVPTDTPIFLGLYVHTEPVKKDFFRRRAGLTNVPSGSLYEFEVPDDFTSATISQLQVEWSGNQNQDFLFAVGQVQNTPATALAKTLDLPSFIRFWASEIFLKSWDGATNNRNNAFVFDDPPGNPQATIAQTRFRFIPHGIDQIFNVAVKPTVYLTSVLAQLAYLDDGLRYQLIWTLASMGDEIETADLPTQIDSFVPLVVRLWRGQDTFFGADRNLTLQKAENARRAAQQAILDLRAVFGHGLVTPPINTPLRLVGPHHVECATRVPTLGSHFDIGRGACANLSGQQWTFEAAATTMTNLGFQESLKLYRVRNQGTTRCLTVGTPFTDASGRFKLQIATCNPLADAQRFYLVQREGRSFELRAFTEDRCAHFSDSAVTSDGRPAIYLGTCDGSSKKLIVFE